MTNLKCKMCGHDYSGFVGLGTHIIRFHKISTKEYYDKFIKFSNEGFCKSCKNSTEFKTLSEGYRPTCSQICSRKLMNSEEVRKKVKWTCLQRYGVENPGSLDWVKKKISTTQIERLLDPKERENISITTTLAMQRPEVKKNHLDAVRKLKSKETIKRMSVSGKQKFINDPTLKDRLYTEERNEKLSKSKKHYWKTHPEERKRIMDIWKKRSETSLETKIYKFLENNRIQFEKRYELDQKQYDAYLPTYNVLLEFDGSFWHKQSLNECRYTFQTMNFYNDIHKNEIAKKHNIPLFRIRETDTPEKILEYIDSIKIG